MSISLTEDCDSIRISDDKPVYAVQLESHYMWTKPTKLWLTPYWDKGGGNYETSPFISQQLCSLMGGNFKLKRIAALRPGVALIDSYPGPLTNDSTYDPIFRTTHMSPGRRSFHGDTIQILEQRLTNHLCVTTFKDWPQDGIQLIHHNIANPEACIFKPESQKLDDEEFYVKVLPQVKIDRYDDGNKEAIMSNNEALKTAGFQIGAISSEHELQCAFRVTPTSYQNAESGYERFKCVGVCHIFREDNNGTSYEYTQNFETEMYTFQHADWHQYNFNIEGPFYSDDNVEIFYKIMLTKGTEGDLYEVGYYGREQKMVSQ